MNSLNDKILSFHPLHAVGFGVLGGYIASKYGYDFKTSAALVSIGSYAYMNKFGHTLNFWNNNDNDKSSVGPVSGVVVVNEPTKQVADATTATTIEKVSYYDGFDNALTDALMKDKGNLRDWIAQPVHKDLHGDKLANAIYHDLGIII